MGNPHNTLLKTCISCGQQKPLSAFLQLSGLAGTAYGNVCASCRKAHQEKSKQPQKDVSEDGTTSTSGKTIDAKTKVRAEADKRELHKETNERYNADRDAQEEKQLTQTEKATQLAQTEKNHREQYLKKQSFLSNREQNTQRSQPVFGGEDQKAQEAKIDLGTAVVDRHIAGKLKYQTAQFSQFKALLGKSAPITGGQNATTETAAKQTEQNPTQFIQETWGQNSRKKR